MEYKDMLINMIDEIATDCSEKEKLWEFIYKFMQEYLKEG